MTNKEFSKELEKRTMEFAINIIKLSVSLPKTEEFHVIKTQVSKSGTSVGANYHEANRSRSKADFSNKIKICESEANETLYWLEIIEHTSDVRSELLLLMKIESKELIALFTSISNSLRV